MYFLHRNLSIENLSVSSTSHTDFTNKCDDSVMMFTKLWCHMSCPNNSPETHSVYCPCPFVYEICYSGLPSSVFLTSNTIPRYQSRFVSGQDIQFWLDMKDNWIDPMKHQNVESSDQQVNVSSTDNVVSTTRVDQTSDDEDWLL